MAGLWYRSGTIAVTGGSKKVVGTGTTWKSGVYKPDKGHLVWGPDGKPYELDYVESDTVLYLVTAYSGVTATGMAYSIDITRTSTIPAFSRELSAQLAYAQAQYDSWQQVISGSGIVTLTAPDGQQVQVPALSAFQPTSASLKALQALTPVKDKIPVFNGPAGAELITLTAFIRTLLDDVDASTVLSTLGVSTFAKNLLDDANAAAVLITLDIGDLYKKRNILGIVSQSAGAPTGAIIERGSNANGDYTKFADGFMVCTGTLVTTLSSTPLDGTNGASLVWTFPASFGPTPRCTVQHGAGGKVLLNGGHPGISNASFSCYVASMSPFTGLSVTSRFSAIGYWY
ncbi:hypothetical protein KAM448_05810 [Aeromonas caviae]|uniref:Phage tail protein n=1 Tax=Aeromonas caviae TaxID=648 RepID=A0ABD0B9J7_AERCA|nr:hypothetical protein [Aeromonas caviae]BCR29889.1 hypothetical protein KAM376_28950 [Aeromonas caviae]GJA80996.1 hypothetical protein KAM355_15560 [Aeromonas caviae]GJA98443.1 hypothetical protein KAM359_18510 [Aeromonas caviae]GJB10795.1 hypothetical protein KAM362_13550 [Aeromonas caviae]GJB23411.1 hypothetical protein KAM365_11610 [Aeromonas caviae]